MMLFMQNMTSQASQRLIESRETWDYELPAAELSQVTAPLAKSDRDRLQDFWSRVIADCGADLPGRREAPVHPARRARRVQRQRSVRLVRVLTTARSEAVSPGSAVAA